MKQLDIFGNEIEIEEVPASRIGRPKTKTMQEKYGAFEGFICGNCKHLVKYEYNNKTYYKCELWFISHSEASDIRLRNVACKKYENK